MTRPRTQHLPPGHEPYTPSHQTARCDACESVLYDVPVLGPDGCRVGRFAMRCPHCHDGRPAPVRVAVAMVDLGPDITGRAGGLVRARQQMEAADLRAAAQRRSILERLRAFHKANGRAPYTAEWYRASCFAIPSKRVIQRAFGSIGQALDAAGVPRNRRGGKQTARTVKPHSLGHLFARRAS